MTEKAEFKAARFRHTCKTGSPDIKPLIQDPHSNIWKLSAVLAKLIG